MTIKAEDYTYIGDGVYARFDNYYVWVTTEPNSYQPKEIAFDSEVMKNLIDFYNIKKGDKNGPA